MTIKIKLSTLTITAEEFARRVLKHAAAMLEYRAHLEGVAKDAADNSLKPGEERVAFPPPSEEVLIELAAVEGYEFEGPTLDEKKAALFAEVRRKEAEAINAVIPPHKARHWEYRERDIQAKRDAALERSVFTGTLQVTFGDEDDNFMNDMVDRRSKQAAIQRHAAKHEHDIGDLTEETIDHYDIGKTFS